MILRCTMPKIKTLSVKACRGIRDTSLDFDGKSIVVYGENGHGKSSFVDSIELLFKKNITHLDEAQSTSTKRHTAHILFDPKDTEISLSTVNPNSTIVWNFSDLSFSPKGQKDFWENGNKSNFILRRQQILDFIIAKPAGRYEQIAQVIGISDLDNIELNFKRRRDELLEDSTSLDSQLTSIEDSIFKLLDLSKFSENEILGGLNTKLVELGQKSLEDFNNVDDYKLNTIKQTKDSKDIEKASNIHEALKIIENLQTDKSVIEQQIIISEAINSFQLNIEAKRDFIFYEILEKSREIITEYMPDNCPVCEKPINNRQVIDRLNTRLELLADAKIKSKEIAQKRGEFDGKVKEMFRKLDLLKEKLINLGLETDVTEIDSIKIFVSNSYALFNSDPFKINLDDFQPIANSNEYKDWEKFLLQIDKSLRQILEKISVVDSDKNALQAIEIINQSIQLLKDHRNLTNKKEDKLKVFKQIDLCYKLFIQTKQNEIQDIYNKIQKDVQGFYDELHPNEDHREIFLTIDPNKRGSTEISMGFHDKKDDPRAYQSEAHLDSLGLCTFLAFAKNFNSDFKFLILDDVVGTIDGKHRQRICDLLFTQFNDFQLFITTHDAIWFEELVSHQRALNVLNNFKNLKIINWTLREGLKIDCHKPRWEVIELRLNEGDKESASIRIRIALEWILEEMVKTTKTKIIIPSSGKLVVSNMYDDFNSRIKKLIPDIYEANQQIFVNLEADGIFGNLLAHNNIDAQNVSMDEVRSFSTAVKDFFDLFTCENEQLMEYHQNAKVMKCRCGHQTWNTK